MDGILRVDTPAGRVESARDLSAAFVVDPLISWSSRTDEKRDAAREAFFLWLMNDTVLPDGLIFRPQEGGAAAAWIPSEAMTKSHSLLADALALPLVLRHCGWSRLPRILRLRAALDRHHPMDRPHDYLFMLGVAPAGQGKGTGSRLIRHRLSTLDAQGRAAFLETAGEANVGLYARHGFQVVEEYYPGPGGPKVWAMWRDPVTA